MRALILAGLSSLVVGSIDIPPNASNPRAPSVQELRTAIISVSQNEYPLWSAWPNAAMASSTKTGGFVTGPATTLTRATVNVTSAGGGGAGNTTITVTDGTNTCTFTFLCTVTNATGAFSIAAVNGSGTGCVYAAGAALSASVTTGSCTTTQPTISNVTYIAQYP